jgi:hypothetical protein
LQPATVTNVTSLNLHIAIAETAKPGAYVLNFKKADGTRAAAVFLVFGPPGTTEDIDSTLNSYLVSIEQQRLAAVAALNAVQLQAQQVADIRNGQLATANRSGKPQVDTKSGPDIQGRVSSISAGVSTAQIQAKWAAQAAKTDFTNRFNAAVTALKARNASGAPDSEFRATVASAFSDVNSTFTKTIAGFVDALETQEAMLAQTIAQLEPAQKTPIAAATPGGVIPSQIVECANFTAGALTRLGWSLKDEERSCALI